MTARIYTGAEARALLDGTTPGPWRTYGNAAHDDAPSDAWTIEHDGDTLAELRADDRPQYGDASDEEVAEVVEADADLMAAAPDLAASVAFHARRAEKAEAELIEAHDRARDAEAERAAAEAALTAAWQAVTDDDLPRLATGDGTVVDAEAVGRRVAALVSQRDTANADFVVAADGVKHLARQVDHLEEVLSSTVRGVLDAIGARDRAVPNLPFSTLAAWLATETRLVVDDLTMARDNHHARAERAEAEVARLTVALSAQTARADGAEATELRLTKERDAAIAAANDIDRMMSIVLGTVLDGSETTPNCNEFRGTYKGREFAMAVQWANGKSPHALIAEARKERDALRAAVREYFAAEREYERDPCVDSDRYIAASKTLAALVEVTP